MGNTPYLGERGGSKGLSGLPAGHLTQGHEARTGDRYATGLIRLFVHHWKNCKVHSDDR